MITHAFIAEKSNKKLGHEESLVVTALDERSIPYSFYTTKKIHRRQLPLSAESLVVGNMDCIYGALKQLGIPIPPSESYPSSLRSFLHRKVRESTLGQEEKRFAQGYSNPTFIKPRGRQKRFTGFVFKEDYDFQRVYGVSRQEPVYCSSIVSWVSEYRVYVVGSSIRSIDHYDGDPNTPIDISTVELAISTLKSAGEAYAAYGIDFGVLTTGQTALIEMNDGFALGAYSIKASDYTDLIITRWEELLATRT